MPTEISEERDELLFGFNNGAVIVYATEAVMGIGCDPNNEEAVLKLLEIKQRPVEKGLILVAANYSQLFPYVDDKAIPMDRRTEIFSSWPGPITWLLPKSKDAPRWITGEHDLIATRVTSYKPLADLCLRLQKPIVSTSANLSGREPARTINEAKAQLGDDIFYIDGEVEGRTSPSVIKNSFTGQIIRA